MWRWFHQWGSPKFFYHRSCVLIPVLALASGLILGAGVFWGLFIAPADYQQGESVRIMYVHVPAAILAQSSYAMMAVMALISLIWRLKIADAAVQTVAPIGACITLLALATGSLWGKPMWGTYWVWDARLTSMLILAFLYLGIIGLRSAMLDPNTAGKACAILALVGAINLPIIKYSVEWWNTLYQPASLTLTEKPAMPASMWVPLLINICGYYAAAAYLVFASMRGLVLHRERRAQWVRELVGAHD